MNPRPKLDKIAALALVACLLVVAGEAVAYSGGSFEYSSSAAFGTDSVSYNVNVSGAKTYSALLTGGSIPCSHLYIYDDETYEKHYPSVRDSGVGRKNQGFAIDQISKSLNIRGFSGIEICGGSALAQRMSADLADGTASSKGLLVLSYAMPVSIYAGSPDGILMKWITAGGKLYWSGGNIGKYYTEGEELKTVDGNQELFFGKLCVNTGKDVSAYTKIDGNGVTDALTLKHNSTKFGIDIGGLADAVSFGYSGNGYASIASVKHGEGSICVIAGDYNYNQRDDIAQIVASGISWKSEIIKIDNGTAGKGSNSYSMTVPPGSGKLCLYISVGGTYIVHGGASIGP